MNVFLGLYRDLVAILPEKSDEAESSTSIDPQRQTIVFVSGFGAPQRGLRIIKRRLVRDGYNVVLFSLHWQDVTGGVGDMALSLGREILNLKKVVHSSPVHIVAHSAGGIVARFYIQLLGGSHYCETLTTLATPHHGTWLALLGFFSHLAMVGKYLLQLSPRSRTIRKLNEKPIPTDLMMTSIYSTDDWICNAKTARLPRRYENCSNVKSVVVRGLSHSDFLLSKRGYKVIQTSLRGGGKKGDTVAAVNA